MSEKKLVTVATEVTEKTYRKIEAVMKLYGYNNVSDYLKHLVWRHIEGFQGIISEDNKDSSKKVSA